MIWPTSPQPSFSLLCPWLPQLLRPLELKLWILAKGVTNKSQRGEVKWEVSLVGNSDLLTTVYGFHCGIMLPGTFVGLSFMMPWWSSISFKFSCVATLSISKQPREMAAEMMARGIYWLDSHISWTLTFFVWGMLTAKKVKDMISLPLVSLLLIWLASLLFILCPYTASGCLWTD